MLPQATAVVFLALFTRFFDCRMRPDTVVTGALTLAGTLDRIDSINTKLKGAKLLGIKRMVVPEVSEDRPVQRL
jgi:predicted ATP-dependent serine protease